MPYIVYEDHLTSLRCKSTHGIINDIVNGGSSHVISIPFQIPVVAANGTKDEIYIDLPEYSWRYLGMSKPDARWFCLHHENVICLSQLGPMLWRLGWLAKLESPHPGLQGYL